MNSSADAVDQFKAAFRADDALGVGRFLTEFPELKMRINETSGPFGSPLVVNARSRTMLDVLLDAGADINAKSDWWAGGFGILHSADPEISKYAIERGAIVDIHAAARLGMLDRLKELIAGDPSLVHARGGDGQLPLHFASTIEIAEFLVTHGAEIDARDLDHESTAAQWMIDERQDIVRILVSRGCTIDLLMAAALGDAEHARQILDADSDAIRVCVSDDYFPMVGGKNGGAIYQWKLGWYVSPHRVALKFGHTDLAQWLLERSPPDIQLVEACWRHDAAAASSIRADLTPADRRHLAHAARNNDFEAVRLFLANGFPVDATSQHRATPLHWAAFHGNMAMIQLLLPHDPPLEVLDADFGGTPLGWAIYGSQHGWNCTAGDYAGTVELLIAAGAKLPEKLSGTGAVQEVLRRNGVKETPGGAG
jgi:ankyrin repeat protein